MFFVILPLLIALSSALSIKKAPTHLPLKCEASITVDLGDDPRIPLLQKPRLSLYMSRPFFLPWRKFRLRKSLLRQPGDYSVSCNDVGTICTLRFITPVLRWLSHHSARLMVTHQYGYFPWHRSKTISESISIRKTNASSIETDTLANYLLFPTNLANSRTTSFNLSDMHFTHVRDADFSPFWFLPHVTSPITYLIGSYRKLIPSDPSSCHSTIIYFHPNAISSFDSPFFHSLLRNRGFDCTTFIVEYAHYGPLYQKEASRPRQSEIIASARSSIRSIFKNEFGIGKGENREQGTNVVLVGYSMGGAIALDIASGLSRVSQEEEGKLGGVIIASTFSSVQKIAMEKTGWFGKWMVSDVLDSDRKVSGLKVPLTVIHGTEDQMIPIDHAKRLVRKARDSGNENVVLREVENCGHQCWGLFHEITNAIIDFELKLR